MISNTGLPVALVKAAKARVNAKQADDELKGILTMRYSNDEIKDGFVWEGFDYALQVWVREGVVEPCSHPDRMRVEGRTCCHAYQLAGKLITEIKGAECRELSLDRIEGDAGD